MLDGNVLLRQERDEVPEGTLSCPYRTLADYHRYRHYEGLRLLPSACDEIIIQQTLIINKGDHFPNRNSKIANNPFASFALNTLFKNESNWEVC